MTPQIEHSTQTGSTVRRMIVAVVAMLFLAVGCAAPIQVFLHPDADLSYYQRVGVLPFYTLASDRFAGEKFTVEFTTALFASGLFEVVEQGIFINELQKLPSSSIADGLTVEELNTMSKATGTQGIFEGTVVQYEMVQSNAGRYPVISVEARLLDAATGTVVWSATLTERGGPKTPIFGIGEIHTLGELSQKMSNRMLEKLK